MSQVTENKSDQHPILTNRAVTLLNAFDKLKQSTQNLGSTASMTQQISAETIGSIIKKKRKLANLTQQQLAAYSGTGRRFISELENGKDTLEFGKLVQVCQALGLDLFIKER